MPKKVSYSKLALSLDDQVALLQGRGLTVKDRERAKHYLGLIGYFRLAAYARHLRDRTGPDPERYLDGATFDTALDLYIFDRKMRVLLLDALERIEVAVKAVMSNKIGVDRGTFWVSDANNFDRGSHQEVLDEILMVLGNKPEQHRHQFIAHFYQKYSDPYPPCWMLMECLTFSAISRIYKRLKGQHRQQVSAEFGLQHDILESWLHFLSYVRNLCAHHASLWSRSFTIRPQTPKKYQQTWPNTQKLFIGCCVAHHMMKVIADGSQWSRRLEEQVMSRSIAERGMMGFPVGWEQTPFWSA